jgi:AcrR family transcriptional regulator
VAPRKPARNKPLQARSRATVTAILDAMTQVLDREGEAAATTTRVAELAGVSIGTLYQYFSDRDALLDALQDREFERTMELMERVLATNDERSPRETAQEVVAGLLGMYAAAPGLHRALALDGLRVTPTERVRAFDMRVVSVVRNFLAVSGWPVRRKNLDAAAFVIFQSVRATMLARMLEAPPGLDDRTVTDEVTDLVLRYLIESPDQAVTIKAPAAGARSPARPRARLAGRPRTARGTRRPAT